MQCLEMIMSFLQHLLEDWFETIKLFTIELNIFIFDRCSDRFRSENHFVKRITYVSSTLEFNLSFFEIKHSRTLRMWALNLHECWLSCFFVVVICIFVFDIFELSLPFMLEILTVFLEHMLNEPIVGIIHEGFTNHPCLHRCQICVTIFAEDVGKNLIFWVELSMRFGSWLTTCIIPWFYSFLIVLRSSSTLWCLMHVMPVCGSCLRNGIVCLNLFRNIWVHSFHNTDFNIWFWTHI